MSLAQARAQTGYERLLASAIVLDDVTVFVSLVALGYWTGALT